MAAVAAGLLGAGTLWCCGPNFPQILLIGGDATLLAAPTARFHREILLLAGNDATSPTPASQPAARNYQGTVAAELQDLEAFLDELEWAPSRKAALLDAHERARRAIDFRGGAQEGLRPNPDQPRIPPGQAPSIPPELPEEFALYFQGSLAWHEGRWQKAQNAWQSLLALPPAQRRFKSTWAAFMLGRAWEDENPSLAIGAFRDVRMLAESGFADRLNLALDSLGFEARLHWRQHRPATAMDLYLRQAALGEPSAAASLEFCARQVLRMPQTELVQLARQPRIQSIVTAHLISGGSGAGPIHMDGPVRESMIRLLERVPSLPSPPQGWHRYERPASRWLLAMESASVTNAHAAEMLALAAYQIGDFPTAQRWIHRAPDALLARWLQSKLHLRNGRADEAASILSDLARRLPPLEDPSPARQNALFLRLDSNPRYGPDHTATRQLQGEAAVFRLARRDFVEAMDALLRAGYWMDAAYVAERVTTTEELQRYVNKHWPDKPLSLTEAEARSGAAIRYLLARRLAREDRAAEALNYYPEELRSTVSQFLECRKRARDAGRPAFERAVEGFEAATILRRSGMEITGTEVEPDWRIHEGAFAFGVTVGLRLYDRREAFAGASAEEIDRGLTHGARPEARFHYRYRAAEMAWDAARLMPDHRDETARMLWTAGRWLKDRDPEAADRFYKALVNRCGRTALGREADRLRWFPPADPTAPSERAD